LRIRVSCAIVRGPVLELQTGIVLVLGLECMVFGLVLGLEGKVLVNITGPHWNIAKPLGTEKLEWCGYPVVNKSDNTSTHFDKIHECDIQTDGRTDRRVDTARRQLHSNARQLHSNARQKSAVRGTAGISTTEFAHFGR